MSRLARPLRWLAAAAASACLAASASALSVGYSDGYVDVDFFHKARMNLTIQGDQVTGTLESDRIVQSNVRLPGHSMKFTGTLEGGWEKGGSISGDVTGSVLWPDRSEDREGQFWITKTEQGVVFRSTKFYYNKYVFTPAGVDYTAAAGGTNAPGGKKVGKKKPSGPVSSSIILLFDCSSSMTEKPDKFERFKKAAKSSIDALGAGCEVALITFSDCNQITLVEDFAPMTDDAKDALKAAVDALATGSSTPLAQALTFAGDHMRSLAKGSSRQIILLSDGIESCDGDPVTAAGGLNIKQVGGKKNIENVSKKKKDKDKKPPPEKDEISSILVEPALFEMAPDSERTVPGVIAVMKKTFDQVPVPADQVEWIPLDKEIEVENGKIRLSKTATVGKLLGLKARVQGPEDPFEATARIEVKPVVRRGKVDCSVRLEFTPPLPTEDAVYPVSAVLQLRKGGTPYKTQNAPGGDTVFEDVDEGTYHVWIQEIVLPDIPEGYEPKEKPPCYANYWVRLPSNIGPDEWTANAGVGYRLRNDTLVNDASIYGTVTFEGQPIAGVKVTAAKTGSQESDVTDGNGSYRIKTTDLEAGQYWIRAEKIVIPRWTDPDDLLDVNSYKNGSALMASVPVGPGGVRVDIECVKRGGESIKDDIPIIEAGPQNEGAEPPNEEAEPQNEGDSQ